MRSDDVIAILVSDVHLSLKQPICRDPSVNWFDTMAFYLDQLSAASDKHNAPIICAGDVFDKWNSSAELINFALDHLPEMYSIPGQHDLPTHNYGEIHRSAYWTLVQAGRLKPLEAGKPTLVSKDLVLWAFPWEHEVKPCDKPAEGKINLAVVHEYCWKKGASYPGAPDGNKVAGFKKKLKGYDAAVFGDNHKGFLADAGGVCVLNHGGFMRRKSDEKDYQPCIGLLYGDGMIERHKLDTSIDKFVDVSEADEAESMNMDGFIEELESLGESGLNFVEAVERFIQKNKNDITEGAEKFVREALEE